MKISVFFCLSFFIISFAQSQSFYRWGKDNRLSAIIGMGLNNYYGELNDRHHFDIDNYNLSLALQYPLTANISLRGTAMFYKIKAADRNSKSQYRRERNLSFRGRNFEVSLATVFYLFSEYLHAHKQIKFNPFLLGGIGLTYFNPETYYQGKWYDLRALKTEGVSYKQISPVFPIGIGVKYNLNRDVAIIMECAYRFTTTDYLDDVSTQYKALNDSDDPIAAILADRRPEIGASPAEAGMLRGNPKTNDGYLTLNIKCSFKIGSPKPLRMHRKNYMY